MTRMPALITPLLILAFTVAFNIQTAEARSSATMIPQAISVLILGFSLLVVWGEMRRPPDDMHWADPRFGKSLALLGLSLGYCVLFIIVDFHVANFVFLIAAASLMRLPVGKGVVLSLICTVAIYGLASVMDFNLPDPIWQR